MTRMFGWSRAWGPGVACVSLLVPALASAGEPIIVTPAVIHGHVDAAVTEQLETRLREVIRKSDLEIVELSNERNRRAAACEDDACRAKLIAAGHAQFLLVPQISFDDGDYELRLTLYGPEGATVARLDESCGLCGLAEAADVMSDLGARIGRKVDVVTRASVVEIRSDPPGAQVYVGRDLVGVTPFELPLVAGVHELRVELAGYITLERRLEVTAGETNTLELGLQRDPTASESRFNRKLWVGVGWGSIVAGLGAAAGGATLMVLDERPIRSDCSGVNIDVNGTCRWRYSTLEGGIGLIAGSAVLLGAGIALIVLDRKRSKSSKSANVARLQPSLTGLGVRF